jgi:hypothetical protein
MDLMTVVVFLAIGAAAGWQFGKKIDGGASATWKILFLALLAVLWRIPVQAAVICRR